MTNFCTQYIETIDTLINTILCKEIISCCCCHSLSKMKPYYHTIKTLFVNAHHLSLFQYCRCTNSIYHNMFKLILETIHILIVDGHSYFVCGT